MADRQIFLEKQPKAASTGSVFKNPPLGPAGMFIEKAGSARAEDILALMQKIIDQVYEQFGLILEPEVRIIGQ